MTVTSMSRRKALKGAIGLGAMSALNLIPMKYPMPPMWPVPAVEPLPELPVTKTQVRELLPVGAEVEPVSTPDTVPTDVMNAATAAIPLHDCIPHRQADAMLMHWRDQMSNDAYGEMLLAVATNAARRTEAIYQEALTDALLRVPHEKAETEDWLSDRDEAGEWIPTQDELVRALGSEQTVMYTLGDVCHALKFPYPEPLFNAAYEDATSGLTIENLRGRSYIEIREIFEAIGDVRLVMGFLEAACGVDFHWFERAPDASPDDREFSGPMISFTRIASRLRVSSDLEPPRPDDVLSPMETRLLEDEWYGRIRDVVRFHATRNGVRASGFTKVSMAWRWDYPAEDA